ncbi:hypothetical protein ABZX77_40725 [Streptomyces sp. NPDC004237]|uniref:hypothetical protein n=1 Tax=Streptomyces sp. NPDC004237 TaxID=3154455 RepID=UPI0033A575D8
MHDRVAELAGLRNELAICKNGPRESRRDKADEVQEQIDRVRAELQTEAERLQAEAEQLLEGGRDGLAGETTERARAIREALDADESPDVDEALDDEESPEAPKRGGKRTAAAKPPQNRGGS